MIPDGLKVARNVLNAAGAVSGVVAGIYSVLPGSGAPTGRFVFLRDLPIGRPRIMAEVPYVRTTLQVDGYGGTQGQAHDLVVAALDALVAAQGTIVAGVALSRVEWYGLGDLPDDSLLDSSGNARARSVVSVELDLRPAP